MTATTRPLGSVVTLSQNGCGVRRATAGVPTVVLRLADVSLDGTIATSGLRSVLLSDAEREKYLLRRGDILVWRVNGSREITGRAVVFDDSRECAFCDHFIRLRLAADALPAFVAAQINRGDARAKIEAGMVTTAGQNTVSQGTVLDAPIQLPTLREQRRIADILDKADAIRRKRAEAITLTDELLRSTFLEMFGDPVTNPKGWPSESLESVADLASGVAKGKAYGATATIDVPYMRVANVQDGHLVLDEVKTIRVSHADAERYRLLDGDVLLTEGGDPDKLGRGAVWRGEVPGSIHQNHIFRARCGHRLLPEYLSALIGSEFGKRYFLRAAKQTTGIASINMTQLRRFPVLIPPMVEQRRYQAAVGVIGRASTRQRDAAIEVDRLSAAVVHRAFSGGLS